MDLRSPRLASADVEAGKTESAVLQHTRSKGGSMGLNGVEEKDTEKFSRRSPRLMSQSEMNCCYQKVSTQEVSLRYLQSSEKGCSRAMSLETADAEILPRHIKLEQLSDSQEKWHSKKILINTLNEILRRSPEFSSSVAAANSNPNSSIELSGSKSKGPLKNIMVSSGSPDLRNFDGRCLRQSHGGETKSDFIQLPENETRETEHAFIEFPETRVNQPPKNVKTSSSSRKR